MRSFIYACYGDLAELSDAFKEAIADSLNIDTDSKALGTIEQEHLKIHAGKLFTFSNKTTLSNGGGVAEFVGEVPAGSYPHYRKLLIESSGGPFDIEFFEAPTYTGGTPVVPVNNNRNSVITPELVIKTSPSVSDPGTRLEIVYIDGSKQVGAIGSDAANEWVLAESTNYLIRITNNTSGGGTSVFSVNMFWYE